MKILYFFSSMYFGIEKLNDVITDKYASSKHLNKSILFTIVIFFSTKASQSLSPISLICTTQAVKCSGIIPLYLWWLRIYNCTVMMQMQKNSETIRTLGITLTFREVGISFREGFTKKSCCSFGNCPNEGGWGRALPKFVSPFHKCFFGQFPPKCQ